MLQLFQNGECSIEHLRAEIGTATDFRNEVLRHFDELVVSNKITEEVEKAKERSAKFAAITTRRYRRHTAQQRGTGRLEKLSEQDVDRIRQILRAGDLTWRETARRFAVSVGTIARIVGVQA